KVTDFENQVFTFQNRETLGRHCDRVGTERKVGKAVVSAAVRVRRLVAGQRVAGDDDMGVGYFRASGILHCTLQSRCSFLAKHTSRQQQDCEGLYQCAQCSSLDHENPPKTFILRFVKCEAQHNKHSPTTGYKLLRKANAMNDLQS